MKSPTPASHGATPTDVLSVSQLNRLARSLLEECFPGVWVEGEISNLSRPSSGHWYFTLKDGGAQVRCAMFRNRNIHVRFQPSEGQKVVVRGSVSLYEARGDYQLIAEQMQPAGAGLLALQFEQLKQKLQAEGLFDAGRKRPLPRQPHHIAVITSPTGAAIRDILTVLKRRAPAIHITVIPVVVQGEQAAPAIARAIAVANQLTERGRADFDEDLIARYQGQRMFMGTPAIGEHGVMESDPLLIQAEQKLLRQAEQLVVLADSSKVGARAELQFCPLERVNVLITDNGIDAQSRRQFEDAGIEVIAVEAGATA